MNSAIRNERDYLNANAEMRLLEPTDAVPFSALRPEQRERLLHLSYLCAEYETRTADLNAAGDYRWRFTL